MTSVKISDFLTTSHPPLSANSRNPPQCGRHKWKPPKIINYLTYSSRHFFDGLVKVPSLKGAAHANLRVDGRVVPWDASLCCVEQGECIGNATLQHACTLYK